MLRRVALISGIAVLASSTLLADFSYEQTSTITGGMVARMMKFASVFSKKAGEPIHSTIAVKGNKMVNRTADSASIIDLDAQTITTIDYKKRTYSVMTFEQMKEMLAKLSQKAKQNNTQMQFKVTAHSTGATRQIDGFNTKETIVKMEMEGTDQKSGQTGAMDITTDMWLASDVPGYAEVRDFYKRMAQKINWAPSSNMFMANPQVSKGMAEVYKETANLNGVPVLQIITMGGAGQSAGASAGNRQQSAQPQQEQQQADKPSMGDAMGSALGHFGFGHRKRRKQQEQEQQQQQASSQEGGSNSGTLLEMKTESANFSSKSLDASEFAVPAGFREVKPRLDH